VCACYPLTTCRADRVGDEGSGCCPGRQHLSRRLLACLAGHLYLNSWSGMVVPCKSVLTCSFLTLLPRARACSITPPCLPVHSHITKPHTQQQRCNLPHPQHMISLGALLICSVPLHVSPHYPGSMPWHYRTACCHSEYLNYTLHNTPQQPLMVPRKITALIQLEGLPCTQLVRSSPVTAVRAPVCSLLPLHGDDQPPRPAVVPASGRADRTPGGQSSMRERAQAAPWQDVLVWCVRLGQGLTHRAQLQASSEVNLLLRDQKPSPLYPHVPPTCVHSGIYPATCPAPACHAAPG
jgi:hypothetical protein